MIHSSLCELLFLLILILLTMCGGNTPPNPVNQNGSGNKSYFPSDPTYSDDPPLPANSPLFNPNWENGDGKIDEKDIPGMKNRIKEMMNALLSGEIQGMNNKDKKDFYNLLANALKSKPKANTTAAKKEQANFLKMLLDAVFNCLKGMGTAQTGTAIVRWGEDEKESSSSSQSYQLAACVITSLMYAMQGNKDTTASPATPSTTGSSAPSGLSLINALR